MKILILSASPQRDNIIDFQISEKLTSMGHEIQVAPMLREGRKAVLEYQPNVCVVPPVRNVYARDFVGQLKKWKVGVVSRHTEPSCDWQDFNAMDQKQKHGILGGYPYLIDAELVWSEDEAQILTRARPAKFPSYAIGAVACDAYMRKDLIEKHCDRKKFNEQYKFDMKKKNLLIASAWGFADTAPDLQINETDEAKKDIEGRDRHFKMIEQLPNTIRNKWNILVTTHPGVIQEPYHELCKKFKIPLDTEAAAFVLLNNSDALIHAGSIMAVNAHILNIPAFQYGDVNVKDSDSWWASKSAMSQISPRVKYAAAIAAALSKSTRKSNASKEAIDNLVKGRFGVIDGKATERAAEIIGKVKGQFTMCWPDNTNDYSQLTLVQDPAKVCIPRKCNICGNIFGQVSPEWIKMLKENLTKRYDLTVDIDIKPEFDTHCPWCGARFVKSEK